jgi:hypothetical protein
MREKCANDSKMNQETIWRENDQGTIRMYITKKKTKREI